MSQPPAKPIRLALLRDFPEEQWPSMDLVAEQLDAHLKREHADRFDTKLVCAKYHPLFGDRGAGRNFSRLYNRLINYPRFAKRIAPAQDLFHLCDHSYSQLLHALPAGRAGVFCHDLDTFRCLLAPAAEPRPLWFRAMANRILKGFRKAAVVFHATEEIRRQILRHELIDAARLVYAPFGIAEEFTAAPSDPPIAIPGLARNQPFILHVGSTIPRKRMDVLLKTFARVRAHHPELRLLKVGSDLTTGTEAFGESIVSIGFQSRDVVAECYRRAQVVLIPSEAEGFGLPVIEALACGAKVLVSDIAVLREVGQDAISYAPVGDVDSWVTALDALLRGEAAIASLEQRLARADQFSWRSHAKIIADAYAAIMVNKTAGGPRRG